MMQESGQILKVGFSENLILQLCEMFQVSQYFTLRNIFRLIIKENCQVCHLFYFGIFQNYLLI